MRCFSFISLIFVQQVFSIKDFNSPASSLSFFVSSVFTSSRFRFLELIILNFSLRINCFAFFLNLSLFVKNIQLFVAPSHIPYFHPGIVSTLNYRLTFFSCCLGLKIDPPMSLFAASSDWTFYLRTGSIQWLFYILKRRKSRFFTARAMGLLRTQAQGSSLLIRVSLKSAQRAHDALESLHAKVQVVIKYWQTLFDTP